MIKKIVLFFLVSGFVFLSCKKKDDSPTSFTIAAKQLASNKVSLSWEALTLTGFKNYSIYRSNVPIPEPSFSEGIDASLLVAIISDADVTSYVDSNTVVGGGGQVYYRVVVNLTNRFVYSNQVQATFDAFAVVLPQNSSFSQYITKTFPEVNMLYLFNTEQGVLSAVSYSQKKLVASVNLSSSSSNAFIATAINNGNAEVFVTSNISSYSYLVTCYDALTLQSKYSFYTNNTSYQLVSLVVYNNFLYALDYGANLITYDLSTKTSVSQQLISSYFPYNQYGQINSNYYLMYLGNQTNSIYIRANVERYNSSTGNYSYKNYVSVCSITSHIPSFSTNLYIPSANPDTTYSYTSTNALQYIQVSPDGKYIECNQQGDIYSTADQSLHNILTPTDFNPVAIFSNDGQYLIGRSNNGSSSLSTTTMDIFSLPSFTKKTSLGSPNAGSLTSGSVFLATDFMDNDTLLSYNVQEVFIQNGSGTSEVNQLTVFYTKIN